MNDSVPTVGVEEEYQLVDPASGKLLPNCKEVMRTLRRSGLNQALDSEIQHELHLNQIEMASGICKSLAEVRETLTATRCILTEAARRNGCALAAAGTNPMSIPDETTLTQKNRYRVMMDRYQQLARDLLIFGCHVHVEMEDRQLGLRVMNRCRRWLPFLQALTANSPYWDGCDTGYASYRRELWAQWPMAGPPPHFEDLAGYQACVAELMEIGAIKDESFVYWDIRLPAKVPTIEFRGADVMTRVEETVGYVGLVRAMVMTAIDEERRGVPFKNIHPNILSYALWHSARFGVSDQLIDPAAGDKIAVANMADRVFDGLNGALQRSGERECVDRFVQNALQHGTGADRQRQICDLILAVQIVIAETVPAPSIAAPQAC